MQRFTSTRDAKEFLVSKIVAEAQREDVSLSEVERKMLYFPESAWTLPDIANVNEAFDRDYDQEKYEPKKIFMLSRNFCADAYKNKQDDLDAWNASIQTLDKEDHYLLVLVATRRSSGSLKTPFSRLLMIGAALAVFALTIMYFLVGR